MSDTEIFRDRPEPDSVTSSTQSTLSPSPPEKQVSQEKKIRLRVRRGNSYAEKEMYAEGYTTVLDLLEALRLTEKHSPLYRHSCHHGSCGTCGCIINGTECLACVTRIGDLGADTVTVEPLKTGLLLKDLVIDQSLLFREISPGWKYVRESGINQDITPPEGLSKWSRFENCIECGCCVSACPVPEEGFIGPFAAAAMNRELENSRNNPERIRQILNRVEKRDGVFRCERHILCSKVCPQGVYPAKHIMNMRRRSEKLNS